MLRKWFIMLKIDVKNEFTKLSLIRMIFYWVTLALESTWSRVADFNPLSTNPAPAGLQPLNKIFGLQPTTVTVAQWVSYGTLVVIIARIRDMAHWNVKLNSLNNQDGILCEQKEKAKIILKFFSLFYGLPIPTEVWVAVKCEFINKNCVRQI